jgi:hypothetical protein
MFTNTGSSKWYIETKFSLTKHKIKIIHNVSPFNLFLCGSEVWALHVVNICYEPQKWNIYSEQRVTLFLGTKETKKL